MCRPNDVGDYCLFAYGNKSVVDGDTPLTLYDVRTDVPLSVNVYLASSTQRADIEMIVWFGLVRPMDMFYILQNANKRFSSNCWILLPGSKDVTESRREVAEWAHTHTHTENYRFLYYWLQSVALQVYTDKFDI